MVLYESNFSSYVKKNLDLLDQVVTHCFDAARASKLWVDLNMLISNINVPGKSADEIQQYCLRLLISLSKCIDDDFLADKKDFGAMFLSLLDQRMCTVFNSKMAPCSDDPKKEEEGENAIISVRIIVYC